MGNVVAIFVAVLGSGLVQFFVNRHDAKKEKEDMSIDRKLTRIQLLLLISDYPDKEEEIMEVAENYFVNLKGNYYLHGIFKHWLEDNHIDPPSWYK